jgi:hypothetical protein
MAKKKAAETETAEAPAVVEQQAKQPQQNGITRPRSGTQTGRVWEIADELSAQINAPVARAEVLKAFEAEGGNSATGATQYGRWRKFHGLGRYSLEQQLAAEDAATVEE